MIAIICVTFTILFLFMKYFHSRKRNCAGKFKDLQQIPCPDGWPLIGNMTQYFWSQSDLWKIPRQKALDYYPIYRLKMFNHNIVVLLDPEDVKKILGETEGSKKGPLYDPFRKLTGNGLVVNNGKLWRNRRKFLTKCFHFSILRNYIDLFNKTINSTISELQKHLDQYVDVPHHIENMTFKIINGTIFGNDLKITDEDSRSYSEGMTTVTRIILMKSMKPFLNLVWRFTKTKKEEDEALKNMGEYVSKAIKNNSSEKIHRDNGYVSMLNLLQSNPQLFDADAVKDEIDTFIFAGQDTTSIALSFMLMVLANYPQYQEIIYREIIETVGEHGTPNYSDLTSMEYLDRFIKESLRLYPPLIMIERILTKEIITKTGYRLPVGTIIFIQLFDIHRNPNLFPEPEKFDPDRFLTENVVKRHPFSYIPFSAGPRNCIAQKYALLEIKATICGLLQNFKLEPVTLIENIEFNTDIMLHAKGGIKVKFTKR